VKAAAKLNIRVAQVTHKRYMRKNSNFIIHNNLHFARPDINYRGMGVGPNAVNLRKIQIANISPM